MNALADVLLLTAIVLFGVGFAHIYTPLAWLWCGAAAMVAAFAIWKAQHVK